MLLARDGAVAASVRDRNAFLFGNVVPDVLVGYMVPDIADPIPYRITHFAESEPIPKPRAWEFWDGYVTPLLHSVGRGTRVEALTIVRNSRRSPTMSSSLCLILRSVPGRICWQITSGTRVSMSI